ncbi:hypothetical protein [Pseudomonas sp. SMV7]|uniref:hypothetical protein n=1 Tax=Pseudomonas sp. SMV7 TaxID=3390194 RepID=UPI003F84D5DE
MGVHEEGGCAGRNRLPGQPLVAHSCNFGTLVWLPGAVYLEQPSDRFMVIPDFPDLALVAESIEFHKKI